ncbi:unnamed protein product [Ambrosiozyma monospora]|uniref:Unnamed protein product n=1 Tax=Ambrosiozyma monospora TaxID=43982 RepID=A0ACB5TE85_AMBMO|nr:unnamed protein product [Ambrosiozyma monospora]
MFSESCETLVELAYKNPNFIENELESNTEGTNGLKINMAEVAKNRSRYTNLLRFSIGCEDFGDIIRDIDQALTSVLKEEKQKQRLQQQHGIIPPQLVAQPLQAQQQQPQQLHLQQQQQVQQSPQAQAQAQQAR